MDWLFANIPASQSCLKWSCKICRELIAASDLNRYKLGARPGKLSSIKMRLIPLSYSLSKSDTDTLSAPNWQFSQLDEKSIGEIASFGQSSINQWHSIIDRILQVAGHLISHWSGWLDGRNCENAHPSEWFTMHMSARNKMFNWDWLLNVTGILTFDARFWRLRVWEKLVDFVCTKFVRRAQHWNLQDWILSIMFLSEGSRWVTS